MFSSVRETMVLSCNWFFRHGVIMMAVSKWSPIHLALSDWRERERVRGEQRDLETAWRYRFGYISTDSLTELKAKYNANGSSLQSSAIHLLTPTPFRPIHSNIYSRWLCLFKCFRTDNPSTFIMCLTSLFTPLLQSSPLKVSCRSLCQWQQTESVSAG